MTRLGFVWGRLLKAVKKKKKSVFTHPEIKQCSTVILNQPVLAFSSISSEFHNLSKLSITM